MRKLVPTFVHLAAGAMVLGAVYGPLPWGAGLAAGVAWLLLIAPATIYATSERPLETPRYEVIPDDVETTAGSDEWGKGVVEQLARHGFVARGRYRLPGPGAFDFARRLDNTLTGEVATIFAGWQRPDEGPAKPIRVVVFYTCFRDGGELVTTNSPFPSLTPDLPGQVSYRLPEVTDANTLYSAHKRLAKADGRKPKPVVLRDDPLVWELEQNRRAIAVQVAHGLGVRDDGAGVLRPTLKGALRSVLLLHPYVSRWHDRRSSAAASAALRAVTA